MRTASGSLKDLHQIHLQLKLVHEKLGQGPKLIQFRKQFALRKQGELQEQRQLLMQLKMAADQKSLQLKTNEGKIAELKLKLNTASSNREFDIFKSQIDADIMANSVLEDEILEVYEKVDRTQESIQTCEEQLSAAQSQEQRIAAEAASIEPELRSEADRLESALCDAERELPANVVERYRRLVQAHGSDALSLVENKSCTSCYTLLTPNECVEINIGKFLFCRSCGRLLYQQADG